MDKVLLILSCVIAVAADMILVWWAKKEPHPVWLLLVGVIFNLVGLYIWAYSMRKGIESATAITVYALFTVAGCSLLGFVIFKEPLSMINGIGLVLGVIALVMLTAF